MKFDEFKIMPPFQQAVISLLEKIVAELEKISSTGESE